ncbi:hydrophobic protein [Streptomycetaceae bacterium NBC_01309]
MAVVLFLFGFIMPLLWVVAIGLLIAWILGTFRRARYGRDHHDDYHRHGRRRRY